MGEHKIPKPELKFDDDACANCKYYFSNPNYQGRVGACRQNSPSPLVRVYAMRQKVALNGEGFQTLEATSIDGYFPPTAYNLTCGKFKRKATNGHAVAVETKQEDVEPPVFELPEPLPGEAPSSPLKPQKAN